MTNDHRAVYEAIVAAQREGKSAALATVTHTSGSMPRHAGSKMLVYADGQIVGTVGGGAMESRVIQAARDVIRTRKPQTLTYTLNSIEDGDPGICGGQATIFVEPLSMAERLVIVGGGHVGRAVAELAHWLGFYVILTDDRESIEGENPEHAVDEYVICKPAEITQYITIDDRTAVACVTRGLPVDLAMIPPLLKTNAIYIGLIGSRRRWQITAQALHEKHGISFADLKRIYAPIGLELEAETPAEIALSIMAQIVQVKNNATGNNMAWHGFAEGTQQIES